MFASGPNHARRHNSGLQKPKPTKRNNYLYRKNDISCHGREYLDFTEGDCVHLSDMTLPLDEVFGARFQRVSDRLHDLLS
jgi:hypothetical protein